MTIPKSMGHAIICMSLCVPIVSGRSRYAVPVENYLRTHDRDQFGKEWREADRENLNLLEDVPYIVGLLSSTDEMLQRHAWDKLFQLAWVGVSFTDPVIQELFRPAVPILERRLDQAADNDKSQWEQGIVSMTALAGVQPSPRGLALINKLADSKDPRLRLAALLALARLDPRPVEAKRIILSRLTEVPLKERLEILAFALDDHDMVEIYKKLLEGDDREAQRFAAQTAAWVGPRAKPLLESLRRVRQRENLDPDVAEEVKTAIDQIEKRR